jgi:hypothetical protein
MRLAMVGLVVFAMAAMSGCGGMPAHAPSSTVVLGQADAGRTVQVKVGDTVRVTLEDDYPVPGSALVWNVTSLEPAVLRPGPVTRSPQVRTGPGAHDTYSADFNATTVGKATLVAHGTTSCEAMLKQSCPDREFNITVVVSS